MSRGAAVLLAALVLAGCAHARPKPASWQWGMPVYPNATFVGKSTADASFVLYRTHDSLDDVYAWYVGELPPNTPRVLSLTKKQATFAFFDRSGRRTVHLQSEPASTSILLTKIKQ